MFSQMCQKWRCECTSLKAKEDLVHLQWLELTLLTFHHKERKMAHEEQRINFCFKS